MAINFVNKVDKCSWPISWSKGHHRVSPLNCVRALEGKFFLTSKCNCQLMVSGWGIIQPHPMPNPKFLRYSQITVWDWVCNDLSDGVQWDVVHKKMPDKVVDMANMLLVRFRCKYGREKPLPVVNLANMPNFLEGRDSTTHD